MYSEYRKVLDCDKFKFDYNSMMYFFKYVELYNYDMFKNISEKTRYFDIDNYLYNPPIGCYYDIMNNKVISYKLSLPNIEDLLTMLINIHEIVHAITIYNRLGFLYDDIISSELYPKIYEYYYILYLQDDELLKKYDMYLDMLMRHTDYNHKKAINEFLDVKAQILDDYNKILQKSKKVVLNAL